MKRAVVDVDQVLWNLHAPLVLRLNEKYNLRIPDPPSTWHFYEDHGISDSDFYREVDAVHATQERTPPDWAAGELFKVLHRKGYEVMVASHRSSSLTPALARWLERFGMTPFAGVYCGYAKSFLFGSDVLVIDDSPVNIKNALEAGSLVLTIAYPYNAHVGGGVVYFDSLADIVKWVEER